MRKKLRNSQSDAHSQMISLTYGRVVLPQTRPQTRPQPADGEQLVITPPKGWWWEDDFTNTRFSSPSNDANLEAIGYKGFATLSSFQNWVVSRLDDHYYRPIGSALVYVPYHQFGLDRRFKVNNLDIVIREYQDAGKLKYLGVGCARLRDVSVSVHFTAPWNAVAEYRKLFEKSLGSIRFTGRGQRKGQG